MSMRHIIGVLVLSIIAAASVSAHCDGIDGPVVTAARKALASGDVNLVMPWVQPGDGAAIRQAFDRTLVVRKLNPDARDLADTWFFETLVRIHRAGEGAPYDGLKPAGRDPGPAITAADESIEAGNDAKLRALLAEAVEKGLHERFHRVMETRDYKSSDVNAGRAYVAAYVEFIHFAERLHQTVAADPGHAAAHEH
jgi:hypothetical protein